MKRIGIIGLGLLGSSLCLALKDAYKDCILLGNDINENNINTSIQEGWLQDVLTEEKFSDLDFLFICSPVQHIFDFLHECKKKPLPYHSKTNCIIIDTGSVKKDLCKLGSTIFASNPHYTYIGSHPMTGSEKSGIEARSSILYDNISWLICQEEPINKESTKQIENLIKDLHAHPIFLDPATHDDLLSKISHLPQLISNALACNLSNNDWRIPLYAAGGLKDMTRLSGSSYKVWKSILEHNQKNIISHIDQFIENLKEIKLGIQEIENSPKILQEIFDRSNQFQKEFTKKNKQFIHDETDSKIFVHLEDKPGSLYSLLYHLDKENLNIRDIEMMKVKEGEIGSVQLVFKKTSDAKKAYTLISNHSYEAGIIMPTSS